MMIKIRVFRLSFLTLYYISQMAYGEEIWVPVQTEAIQDDVKNKQGILENFPSVDSGIIPDIDSDENPGAQCTDGSKKAGHSGGRYRIIRFPKNMKISTQKLIPPASITKNLSSFTHTNPAYISNFGMFETDGKSTGYVKVNGELLNRINRIENSQDNFYIENMMLIRYYPGKYGPKDAQGNRTVTFDKDLTKAKWKMIPRNQFCNQLQISECKTGLKDENADFLSSDQIDFGFQGGPGMIYEGDENLLAENKSRSIINGFDSGKKSLIGIDSSGNPVVVDIEGKIGYYCIAKFMKSKGIENLVLRDAAQIGGSTYYDKQGNSETLNDVGTTNRAMILTMP